MSKHTLAMRLVLDAAEECGEGECRLKGMPKTVAFAWDEVDAVNADPQTLVTEFHAKMGLPVASEPTVGTPEQRCLRVRLMLEELLEFAKAAGVRVSLRGTQTIIKGTGELAIEAVYEPDLVQMTHEHIDHQYVVAGTTVEFGLPVREGLPLIHEANMRKEPVLDSGGKVRKPEGWTPADVSGLLRK